MCAGSPRGMQGERVVIEEEAGATPGPPAREIKGLFNPARRIAGISRKISFSSHGVNGT